jgi:competence protein ComEC
MFTTSPRLMPVWSAPLVPLALALTAGIVADRFLVVPLGVSLAIASTSALAWLIVGAGSRRPLAPIFLWCAFAALGGIHHHWHRHWLDAGDLSHFAERDPQPARIRGTLASAPIAQAGKRDALLSFPTRDTSRFVLHATQRQDLATRTWHPVTGNVQVTVLGTTTDITVGDEVEVLGRLALPAEPMNPGEFDYAGFLRDQGITTTLVVLESEEITLTRRGWPTSLFGWLAVVRGWGQRTLARDLAGQHEVAAALLLGEGSTMTGDAWEQYLRTGVLHVLAISGQHLVILATFLWFAARLFGFRRRHAAPVIMMLLIGYALLTGGRPPVMRAAWVVAIFCGSIILLRQVSPANAFAFGWIGVILVNPTDIFNAGCQLSFLAVAVLVWGIGHWSEEPGDPVQRLLDDARPWYEKAIRWTLGLIVQSYLINAGVWLAVAPLLAANYHTVSPVALLIGPPMVLLTSLALLTGFAFLMLASWLWPIAMLFAWLTQASLLGCEAIVALGQHLPGAYFFVADVPAWWLWIFYLGLLLGMTVPGVGAHARWALLTAGAWIALGIVMQLWPHRPGEFRCTFVAVGHGGCTVIETPNGRVLVYDAGATTGPEVTRRHIAPFLWSRGIRRIDELILSHADLDHFNGVPQLTDRFTIGRVMVTPTFAERSLTAVQKTVAALESRNVDMQVVHAGKSWEVDGVAFAVLHPPPVGPAGKENVRSLVLHVTHGRFSMLLTGDLEEAGMTQVLALPPPRVDVLMAPHHGSDRSNIPELALKTRPKLVVSSQTNPTSERLSVKMYEKRGATFLGTWPHGAITIRPSAEPQVDTYRTKRTMMRF